MRINEIKTLNLTEATQTINTEIVDVSNSETITVVCNITNDNPTAKTFTADPATDQLAISAHGYKTGLKGQVSTTLTLPGGLAAATDYFVIVVDSNNIKLATTHANAVVGIAIDITTAGTGVQTFTPTALAGGSVKLQYSLDEITWIDVQPSTAITASMVFSLIVDRFAYPKIRLLYELTAGQLSLVNKVSIKI